jgi:hypothetical protein
MGDAWNAARVRASMYARLKTMATESTIFHNEFDGTSLITSPEACQGQTGMAQLIFFDIKDLRHTQPLKG